MIGISAYQLRKNSLEAEEHKTTVYESCETMLANFLAFGVRMSIKRHYLFCHLDHFPQNLGDMNEEQG